MLTNLLNMINGMLMMEPRYVESLAAKITALGKNDISLESIKALFGFDVEEDATEKNAGVAVIRVRGAMTNRSWWRTSYQGLSEQLANAMADSSVKRIVFDMDSPGGEVGGVFDLADEIYAARQKIPMSAVVSENACSACYLLAAAAGDISVSQTASVGSIGVVATHADYSGWFKSMGTVHTQIYAGKHKVDGSPLKPLSKDAKSNIQADVDDTYKKFTESVAKYRGMSVESVVSTEAAVFSGQKAVDAGLADRVESYKESMARLSGPVSDSEQGASMNTESSAVEAEIPEGIGQSMQADEEDASDISADDSTEENADDNSEDNTEETPEESDESVNDTTQEAATSYFDHDRAANVIDKCAEAGVSYMASNWLRQKLTLQELDGKISLASEVKAKCKLAGQEQQAEDFIRAGYSLEQVADRLIGNLAAQDSEDIDGSQSAESHFSKKGEAKTDTQIAAGWESVLEEKGLLKK